MKYDRFNFSFLSKLGCISEPSLWYINYFGGHDIVTETKLQTLVILPRFICYRFSLEYFSRGKNDLLNIWLSKHKLLSHHVDCPVTVLDGDSFFIIPSTSHWISTFIPGNHSLIFLAMSKYKKDADP